MNDGVVQPEHATYKTRKTSWGGNQCGRCKRNLPNVALFRCPYVQCREWLIGYGDPQPETKKRKRKKEEHQ